MYGCSLGPVAGSKYMCIHPRLRMIAQRRSPSSLFQPARAYSLRGDRAAPFRSLWPPWSPLAPLSKDLHHRWPPPTSHRIFHDPRYLLPRNRKHECGAQFNLDGREIIEHTQGDASPEFNALPLFWFLSQTAIAAEPLNSASVHCQLHVLPRKAHLLHAPNLGQARLIENNQRGLGVCGGRPTPYEGVGWAGPGRLGAPKWKPNGQLDGMGGLALRVPRIADSV